MSEASAQAFSTSAPQAPQTAPGRRRRLPPALALWLIAPVVGEIVSGSSSIIAYVDPVTFVTLSMLYGSGAVLVRELVVRWGRGWPSLLVLGAAYGIFEEGLLCQSFFNPEWGDLGDLAIYGRAIGVNWVWAEHLTVFHAIFSIGVSVVLAEVLYPARRSEPWVPPRQLWMYWVSLGAVWLVWEFQSPYELGVWRPVSVAAVIGLGALARVLPDPARRTPAWGPEPKEPGRVRPVRYFLIGLGGVGVHFVAVWVVSANASMPFGWFMVLLAVFDLLVGVVVLRWNRAGAAWHDRERLALVAGGIVFQLVVMPLGSGDPVTAATSVLLGVGLLFAARQVRRRA